MLAGKMPARAGETPARPGERLRDAEQGFDRSSFMAIPPSGAELRFSIFQFPRAAGTA
jgi:hypothetical protein